MKKKWIWIVLIIILAFTFGIRGLAKRARRDVNIKTETVTKGDIRSMFSADGVVESKDKREYYVVSPAKVVKVNFEVGDKVKKGDIIAELEVQDMSIQLKTAESQLKIAKLNLDSLKSQKESPSIPNIGGLNQQTSKLDIDNQIKIQEQQVEIAKLNVENIKKTMSKQQRNIKADIDGIITSLNVKKDGMTTVQLPAAVVEDTNNLQIVLNVNQYEIPKIKTGQEAEVRFNGKTYKGTVSLIYPAATKVVSSTGTDTVVKVIVELLEKDGGIKSGFEVDVDILTGEKKNVVKVPAEAIMSDKYDNERVYVVINGVVETKTIKTGLGSDLEFEIVEGLNEGDVIVTNPSLNIKEGTKVAGKVNK